MQDKPVQNSVHRRSFSKPWMWFVSRFSVIIGGTCFGLLSLFYGYNLVLKGAKGEFAITGEIGGVKGFIVSVSPGLGFAVIGALVTIFSYWIQKPNWGPHPYEIHGSEDLIKILQEDLVP